MAVTRLLACLLITSLVQASTLPHLSAGQTRLVAESDDGPSCNCSGTRNGPDRSFVCGDSRLGPVNMPTKFPLLGVVSTYDRLGGTTPGKFLAKWTDAETGGWLWPPQDGFLLDDNGKAILANTTLAVGSRLDRFGSPFGKYLAAADAPFNQRALPPSSLDSDPKYPDRPFSYHVYTVVKPLPVEGGLIAPWFGQPGLGSQFWTGYLGNIGFLIQQGYLVEDDLTKLPAPGDSDGGQCG